MKGSTAPQQTFSGCHFNTVAHNTNIPQQNTVYRAKWLHQYFAPCFSCSSKLIIFDNCATAWAKWTCSGDFWHPRAKQRKITSNIRRVFQNKSWGAESDFFFSHPKNSKGRLSQRSGISTFIRGLSLCSFSVSNNLRGYSEACFIRSGTHTPHETLRLWWIRDLWREDHLSLNLTVCSTKTLGSPLVSLR